MYSCLIVPGGMLAVGLGDVFLLSVWSSDLRPCVAVVRFCFFSWPDEYWSWYAVMFFSVCFFLVECWQWVLVVYFFPISATRNVTVCCGDVFLYFGRRNVGRMMQLCFLSYFDRMTFGRGLR